MRLAPKRLAPVCAFGLVLGAGCASRPAPPADAPAPVPAPESPAAPPAAAGPTRFAWAPALRRVEVRTTVEVTREPAAAGEAPETVRTVAYLTDTLTAGAAPGAVRAAGTVDSVVVDASARVRGAAAAGGAEPRLPPLRYVGAADGRGVRVDAAPDAGVDLRCTAPAGATAQAALAAAREALPRVPAGAGGGARWRDTTVTARCAGPVLVVVQTVSRYEAELAPDGRLAVVRRSASTLRGQGAAGVRPVAVAGAGAAEVRYLLDPARGALAGGAGEGRTTLTVTVAGAAQRFVQRTRTELVTR